MVIFNVAIRTCRRKKSPQDIFSEAFALRKQCESRIASERSRLEFYSFRQKRQYERIKILVFLFKDGIIILRRFMAIKSSDILVIGKNED